MNVVLPPLLSGLLSALLLLNGCSTSSTIYDIDGTPSHLIDCSGKSRSFASCEEKAVKVCKKEGTTGGYRILETDHKPKLVAVPDGFGGVRSMVSETRTMLIQCN